MIQYARRIGAAIASSAQKASLGHAFSRARLVLITILCLTVAFLYWSDWKYYQLVYGDGLETVSIGGTTFSVDSLFATADNLAGILFILAYLGVVILFVLPRTKSSLLRAAPLATIGVLILATILLLILMGTHCPRWLGNTIIWGLPVAVGITLFQELLSYFCLLMARRKLL